jgi:chitinase
VDLIETSLQNLPDSALLQIANNPDYKSSINKLVIGKPVLTTDASTGYMTPELLAESVQDAITKSNGKWNAGIMGWQVRSLVNVG